jgi:hypothetical protein
VNVMHGRRLVAVRPDGGADHVFAVAEHVRESPCGRCPASGACGIGGDCDACPEQVRRRSDGVRNTRAHRSVREQRLAAPVLYYRGTLPGRRGRLSPLCSRPTGVTERVAKLGGGRAVR